jgi:tetratricopeptide (TPR) repeat protein
MERTSRKDRLLDMLEAEPHDVFLNYALGVELFSESKFEEAEQQFLKTLKLNDTYLSCFYQLGQTAEKLNKTEAALEYYIRGLELAKKQNNQKAVNEINEAIWLLEE